MMQHLILHIGRHKTGTTSLQYTLFQNREPLAQAGIYFPETGRKWSAHHDIAIQFSEPDFNPENDELAGELLEEIRNCGKQTILITSEGFQRCDPALLKQVFHDFQITVVVYLRDQVSYLQSSWLQSIHARNFAGTIEEYEQSLFPGNYGAFLSSWLKTFELEQIVARIFSRELLTGGDLIQDFFQTVLGEKLGLTVNYQPVDSDHIITNPSLRGEAIPFKLRLNRVMGSNYYYNGKLYKALGVYSSQVRESANLVSAELVEKLEKKYRESNLSLLNQLSLPASALSFRARQDHDTVEWMPPDRFHRFLESVISMEPDCSCLVRDCYRVELEKQGANWRLTCCANITEDSLKYVKVCSGEATCWLTDCDTDDSGSYLVPENTFNPGTDRLILEFAPDHEVELLLEVKT